MSGTLGALPEHDFDLDRLPAEPPPRRSSNSLNAARAWVQDSTSARSIEDAALRLHQFGWLGPKRVEGYSPFREEDLSHYTDSLGMFGESVSPDETAYIKRRVDALRERQRNISDLDGLTRFLVGAITLEGLATWRVNTIARGTNALSGAAGSAIATGAFAGGLTGVLIAADENRLAGSMKQDLLTGVAFSALFGAALGGGLGAIISRRSADRLGARHAAVHDAHDALPAPPGTEIPGFGEPPAGASGMRAGTPRPRVAPADGEPVAPGRLSDEEVNAHVASFSPGPVERFVEDGAGGGQWIIDQPRSTVQQRVDEFVDWRAELDRRRELEPMTAREARELDDLILSPREQVVVANDNAGGATLSEVRFTDFFDNVGWQGRAANDNLSPEGEEAKRIIRLLNRAMADAEAGALSDLQRTAANVNFPLTRPDSGKSRVLFADERTEAQFGRDATPPPGAANDNAAGAARPPEPPPPAVVGTPGGAGAVAFPPGAVPPGGAPPGGPPGGRALEPPPLPEMVDKDRLAPGSGAGKITWWQMPWYALKNNKILDALGNSFARLADEIVQIPGLRMRGAAVGHAAETSSVEAMAAQQSARYVAADASHSEQYFAYRGWSKDRTGPVMMRAVQLGEGVRDFVQGQRRGGDLSIAEFDIAVMRAIEDPASSAIPEVREAAKAWRDKVLDPMGQEAAAHGVILTPEHIGLALQAISRQMDTLTALEVRADAMKLPKDHAMRADFAAWRKMLDNRAVAATEMSGEARIAYAPHVPMERTIKENRTEFVRRLADWWTSGQARGAQQTWAHPTVRAEIATSHILNTGPGDALEGAIRAHLIMTGSGDLMAIARAAELSAAVKAKAEAVRPPTWKREINALLNRNNDEPDGYGFLHADVRLALDAAGMKISDRLVEEIAPAERFASRDRAMPGHSRERTIDAPLSVMGDFYDLSSRSVIADYVRNMGSAIEMSRKFGDPSMMGRLMTAEMDLLAAKADPVESAKVLQAVRDLRDKQLGRFSAPENADAWSVRTVRLLMSHAILTQMGQSVFAAVADTGRVIMEHGFRPMAAGVWQAVLDREGYKLGGREAKLAGAATELVLLGRSKSLHDLQTSGADRSLLERRAHGFVETMMFVNLLAVWTQMAQEFAGSLTQHTIAELALKISVGRASADEITRLAALGIDARTAGKIALQYAQSGAERHGEMMLLNTEGWTDRALVQQVRAAIKTSVDSQVIKPGNADRPNFLAAPLAQGLLLYKGFGIASTQRTLMAGLQRRDALVVQGMLASLAIAYLFADPPGGEFAKNPIFNSQRLSQAIEKSGVLGIIGDLNNTMEMVSGQNIGMRPLLGMDPPPYAKNSTWANQAGAALGPAVSPWLTLIWSMTDPEAKADQTAAAVRRMVWFQNLIWVDGVSRALSREAGTLMHGLGQPAEQP